MRFWLSLVLIMFLSSCAYVYQVQVGDIDDRESFESSPFEIKVSEKGFNLEEAGEIAEALGSDSGKEVGDLLGGPGGGCVTHQHQDFTRVALGNSICDILVQQEHAFARCVA